MLNINGKLWHELTSNDIHKFLNSFSGETENDENFFFEFKASDVSNSKIVDEVTAFSNTYGGYIFIGVSNDKKCSGCGDWNEERIQNTICDNITPLPSFDVRKFIVEDETVLIIKVDEGSRPPYITGKGYIFERVSSGCRKITSSERLSDIYRKRRDLQERLTTRLEFESISPLSQYFPNNIVAILDIGFEVITNNDLDFRRKFYQYNPKDVYLNFKEDGISSVNRIGTTFVISFGEARQNVNGDEKRILIQSNLNDFMILHPDGSVKYRCILTSDENGYVNISYIIASLNVFRRVYEYLIPDLFKKFVYASKYENLHVIKSFIPHFDINTTQSLMKRGVLDNEIIDSPNIVFTGGRVPSYGFNTIDKNFFDQIHEEYINVNLLEELFSSAFSTVGISLNNQVEE